MSYHKVRLDLVFKNDDEYFKFMDGIGCIDDESDMIQIPAKALRLICHGGD